MTLRKRMGLLLPACDVGVSSSTSRPPPAGTWRAWRRRTSGAAIWCSLACDHLLFLPDNSIGAGRSENIGRGSRRSIGHSTSDPVPRVGLRPPTNDRGSTEGRPCPSVVSRTGFPVSPARRVPRLARLAYCAALPWKRSWVVAIPSRINERTASAPRSAQTARSANTGLPAGSRTKSAGS